MRSLTAAVDAALAAENVVIVMFVELDFASGFVRVHSGVGDIVVGGNTFQGVGRLGDIEGINESTELKANGLRLVLSGVPNDLISIALSENYQGRACRIWIGALDANHRLIADAVGPFKYRMDTMTISTGETSTIRLSVEDMFADWDRPRARRYNDADQKSQYPTDRGFEYVGEMKDKTLFWGRVVTGYQ